MTVQGAVSACTRQAVIQDNVQHTYILTAVMTVQGAVPVRSRQALVQAGPW